MSGRTIPTVLKKGWRNPGIGLTFWSLMVSLELSWCLWVSFSLLVLQWACPEDQGLVEVDLSAILDSFDSNQFMLCPWARSFFQRWCPALFPPFSILKVWILVICIKVLFSLSVVSNALRPHGLQHARLPVLHHLPELAQTHVHCVSDAIQPPCPLPSLSPPPFNLSQHQDLF